MPDADFEISGGEGAVIQTLRQGGHPVSKKTFFWPFGPQFGLKITGVGLPWIRHCNGAKKKVVRSLGSVASSSRFPRYSPIFLPKELVSG